MAHLQRNYFLLEYVSLQAHLLMKKQRLWELKIVPFSAPAAEDKRDNHENKREKFPLKKQKMILHSA